ncbi:MAG TPA: rRNA maturation RNase YbeY, partial [Pyrinomonadaceae bacterium]|nr:rRNA maturation RNase YbeY [Pyrinomonadaceae bacterium]
MIDVVNLQRRIKLETDLIRKYVAELSSTVEEANGKTFSVAFVSDKRMTGLNKLFRGKDSTTDVLSFPMSEPSALTGGLVEDLVEPPANAGGPDENFLGDIVISAERAARQAKENKLSLDNEIKQLILHGLLHLCGYDHETDGGHMNRRELELRKRLEI